MFADRKRPFVVDIPCHILCVLLRAIKQPLNPLRKLHLAHGLCNLYCTVCVCIAVMTTEPAGFVIRKEIGLAPFEAFFHHEFRFLCGQCSSESVMRAPQTRKRADISGGSTQQRRI